MLYNAARQPVDLGLSSACLGPLLLVVTARIIGPAGTTSEVDPRGDAPHLRFRFPTEGSRPETLSGSAFARCRYDSVGSRALEIEADLGTYCLRAGASAFIVGGLGEWTVDCRCAVEPTPYKSWFWLTRSFARIGPPPLTLIPPWASHFELIAGTATLLGQPVPQYQRLGVNHLFCDSSFSIAGLARFGLEL